MQFIALEIDIGPTQAAQLTRAKAAEDRDQDDRTPATAGGIDDGL